MKNIKKGILNCMKRYIFLSSIIIIFIIFGIKLGIILSNSSYYEKKLEEKKLTFMLVVSVVQEVEY